MTSNCCYSQQICVTIWATRLSLRLNIHGVILFCYLLMCYHVEPLFWKASIVVWRMESVILNSKCINYQSAGAGYRLVSSPKLLSLFVGPIFNACYNGEWFVSVVLSERCLVVFASARTSTRYTSSIIGTATSTLYRATSSGTRGR